MKSRMVLLKNCIGENIAGWKVDEFPDWLAIYLNTLPNENYGAPYRLQNGGKFYFVPSGVPLAVGVYELLLALQSNDGQEDAAAVADDNTAAVATEGPQVISAAAEHAEDERLGEVAYKAWWKGAKTFPGLPWERVDQCSRDPWISAARAVERAIQS